MNLDAPATDMGTGILARLMIDDPHIVLMTGPVAHHDHRPVASVFQLIKAPTLNQRRHPGLQSRFAAVGKMHRAFALEADKGLIFVVAMHLVMIAGIGIVMHSGVHFARGKNSGALLLSVSYFANIDYLDCHRRVLLMPLTQ